MGKILHLQRPKEWERENATPVLLIPAAERGANFGCASLASAEEMRRTGVWLLWFGRVCLSGVGGVNGGDQ
jgi:hypothetical protein